MPEKSIEELTHYRIEEAEMVKAGEKIVFFPDHSASHDQLEDFRTRGLKEGESYTVTHKDYWLPRPPSLPPEKLDSLEKKLVYGRTEPNVIFTIAVGDWQIQLGYHWFGRKMV